ncbi:MAG: glycosyltransferase, partial [Cyanobacteria bacterium P01_A01_bin.17]
EDILDDTGAIFYDSDSPAGLRKAMKSAIDAKEQLLEMGKHNLAIAQQWDWKTIAEKTFYLY